MAVDRHSFAGEFEPSSEELRRLGHAFVELVVEATAAEGEDPVMPSVIAPALMPRQWCHFSLTLSTNRVSRPFFPRAYNSISAIIKG